MKLKIYRGVSFMKYVVIRGAGSGIIYETTKEFLKKKKSSLACKKNRKI